MAISQATASGSTTLDQGSDTVISSMTLTPGAGTYLVIFSGQLISNAAPVDADTIFFTVYANAAAVSGTEVRYIEDDSFVTTDHVVGVKAAVTVSAGQAIDVRYRLSPTGRPFTMTNRTLTLLPVASGDVTTLTDTADDTLASATYTVMDGMTTTPASGDYLAVFSTSVEMDTDSDLAAIAVHVGGSIVQHSERTILREQSYNQFGASLVLACKVSPNGSQAVDVRWQRQTGSGTLTARARQLVLVKMASGDLLEATATTDATDSTTSPPQVITSMSHTNPAATDWVAIFGGTDFVTLGGIIITYGIYTGGTLVGASTRVNEHEGSSDAADIWVGFAHAVVSPSGSQTIDVRWQGDTSELRTIHERTFLLVREAAAAATDNLRVKGPRRLRAEVF